MRVTYRGTAVMVDLTEIGVVLRTDCGCRVAIMVRNAKWITGVRILRSGAMLGLLMCVIAAGISLVNAQRTHRGTIAVAVVAKASAQISVIRAEVR